jgi:hypothetical protein
VGAAFCSTCRRTASFEDGCCTECGQAAATPRERAIPSYPVDRYWLRSHKRRCRRCKAEVLFNSQGGLFLVLDVASARPELNPAFVRLDIHAAHCTARRPQRRDPLSPTPSPSTR